MRLSFVALTFSVVAIHAADKGGTVPEDVLSYPVFIQRESGGGGSGFYLHDRDKEFYLVTARHVILETNSQSRGAYVPKTAFAKLISYPADQMAGRGVMRCDLNAAWTNGAVLFTPKRDVALIKIGSTKAVAPTNDFRIDLLPHIRAIERPTKPLVSVNTTNLIRRFKDVHLGNDAYMLGYPISVGVRDFHFDPTFPLIRKGVIAGKDRRKERIILDAPSFGGNSGGPVIELQDEFLTHKFTIIGVVVELVPFVEEWENKTLGYRNANVSNSGYTIVEPVDVLFELLKVP
jgi:hypothetical protein